MQPKKHKTQTQTGLYELFLLTVPIEKVTWWQHKTVIIIFPINLQNINTAVNVLKWRGEWPYPYHYNEASSIDVWDHLDTPPVFSQRFLAATSVLSACCAVSDDTPP